MIPLKCSCSAFLARSPLLMDSVFLSNLSKSFQVYHCGRTRIVMIGEHALTVNFGVTITRNATYGCLQSLTRTPLADELMTLAPPKTKDLLSHNQRTHSRKITTTSPSRRSFKTINSFAYPAIYGIIDLVLS